MPDATTGATLGDLPFEFWLAVTGLVGLFVGSFLNVCIHRLPREGEGVSHPRRSRCPQCRTTLTWRENVPLLSWLRQRGRCRTCGWRIPWRYPLVELLTAGLWLAAALATPHAFEAQGLGLLLIRVVALSGLVVATFVDFDFFEIPDEVSIGGMVLAPIASLAVPVLHEGTWLARVLSEPDAATPSRLGALTGCLAGMAVGGGILWAIGKVGSRIYGVDAMGFGDVKLLAAGGGLLGPGGVLAALMIGSLCASVAGVANIARWWVTVRVHRRRRGRPVGGARALRLARYIGRYVPFGPYLAVGIGIVLLYWNHVVALYV